VEDVQRVAGRPVEEVPRGLHGIEQANREGALNGLGLTRTGDCQTNRNTRFFDPPELRENSVILQDAAPV
jgi:hypothetical protein